MDCSCAVDIYDGDYESVSLLNVKIRKAAKQHTCLECGMEIFKGDNYEYSSYLFDGSFCYNKTCNDCLSVREQFFPRGGTGTIWLDVEYEIEENCGEIPEKCIAKLTPVARGRLCDLIDMFHAQRV